jgi:hypothetical protein
VCFLDGLGCGSGEGDGDGAGVGAGVGAGTGPGNGPDSCSVGGASEARSCGGGLMRGRGRCTGARLGSPEVVESGGRTEDEVESAGRGGSVFLKNSLVSSSESEVLPAIFGSRNTKRNLVIGRGCAENSTYQETQLP